MEPSLIPLIEFCIKKVDDYSDFLLQVAEEQYSSPIEKIKDPLKREFYEVLQKNIKDKLSSSKPRDFLKLYTNSLHIKGDELLEHIVGNPSLLFSFIDPEYNSVFEGNKSVPLVSKVYHFNTEIETDLFVEATEDFDDYFNGGKDLSKPMKGLFSKLNGSPGLFLGHSLSPYSDSICLLYELGRFKRVADIYGVDHRIFLTAPSWAKYNRSAIEIYDDESKRERTLKQCLVFREKLYKQLRIEVDKSEDSDISSSNGNRIINSTKIKQSAKEFAAYSTHINKIEVGDGKDKSVQLLEIIENLCSPDNSDSYVDQLPTELKILAFSIVEDKKNLFVIHTILRHFNSLDENTFYYTLLQRYKQQSYNGWMKLGVESERKFDASFIKLDKVDGYTDSNFGAVYYKHYYFSKGKDDSPLNVIPYTFPSGRVWRRAAGELKYAIDNTILLWDFETSRQQKIKDIVKQMDLKQLAIQMADLLSFCNYFFADDETFWEGETDVSGNKHNGLNYFLHQLDNGCGKAWKNYRNKNDSLKTFCQYFLTMWYAEMDLPYFFYPFMHIRKAERNVAFQEMLRVVYSDIIIYTLTQLNRKIPCSEWK